jgi:hypothetical protein
MAEKRLKIAAAMHDAKDKRVFLFNAVNDHYSPTARLRYPGPKSPSRERPI